MKILIKAEGSPKDWYIIEFQGTLESPDGSLEGRDLGSMFMRDGKPHIVIGNHELVGQFKDQSPALLVLQKVVDGAPVGGPIAPGADEDRMAVDTAEDEEDSISNVHYDVMGVIRKRIVFNTRPKPLLFKKEDPSTVAAKK